MAHQKSITSVLDYIENHLEDDLSLNTLAAVGNYSPFHFHRLFKDSTGQTVNNYVTRKRIEHAAAILLRHPEISVSALSLHYHFSSNASFTRAFKKFYGLSPREFRKNGKGKYSKIHKQNSKNGQVTSEFQNYVCATKNKPMNKHINVKLEDELHFASIDFVGKQNSEKAFGELLSWSEANGLLQNDNFKLASIFYDSLKITAPEHVRMKAALLIEKPLSNEDKILNLTFPKGNYIIGHFEITMEDFERCWTSMFIYMNNNGHKKAERPAFQLYHNDFRTHPEKKCIVDLYIPIT
ncbi:MAG: AraC family transcriptional regulator [Bacteroidota bacterium]